MFGIFGKTKEEKNKSIQNQRDLCQVYTYEIVGEQSYQDNLKRIAGEKQNVSKEYETRARVVSEPTNKFDKNAIKVEINGLTVGYIPKKDAATVSKQVKGIDKIVPAVIVGGWKDEESEGSFGVKLSIEHISKLYY